MNNRRTSRALAAEAVASFIETDRLERYVPAEAVAAEEDLPEEWTEPEPEPAPPPAPPVAYVQPPHALVGFGPGLQHIFPPSTWEGVMALPERGRDRLRPESVCIWDFTRGDVSVFGVWWIGDGWYRVPA